MAQKFIIKAVVQAIRRLPGYPNLKVLDLSCGRGEVLAELLKDGCEVRGTHYRPDDYKLAGNFKVSDHIPIDGDVDLTKSLQYKDESFDVVILCEVLEHLHSHFSVIREAGRILAPGGFLIITTPNIARIHSRWHFFLTGTHKLIHRRIGWDVTPDKYYSFHINPVDITVLHTLLYQAGFLVQRLGFTKFKWHYGWWLILYPLFWLSVRIEIGRRSGNLSWKSGERDLFRWMVKPALLASEQLLLTAKREDKIAV